MEIADVVSQLSAHEGRSQGRYEQLSNQISKGLKMGESVTDKVNINLDGAGGGGLAALAPLLAAGGMGGQNNAMWPIVLLALLGRGNGGLLGGSGDGGTAVNQITLGQIQAALGDIKASVPLAESQVQLALAGAQSDITQQTQAATLALTQQGFAGQLANVQGFSNVKDATDALSTQTAVGFGQVNANIERNGWAVTQAINNDGDKTRALIQSIDKSNDSRLITAQANEIVELRQQQLAAENRRGIEINMTNNQTQNQLQFQAQQQAINTLLNELGQVGQLARATNQQLIIGNQGVTTGGAQTANPTNVRA